ncbi:hypothetical protein [Thalassotalea sp. PLHSN55]|uniref:hypothetical protein n=1 Tax=Thalassotalea sp. PLHSN55 TaxID=3435888 RepID=UPI003F851850
MDINFSALDYLKDPSSQQLKETPEQFLLSLSGPTIIDITGSDQSRCRVLVTLLHGNEPSGLIAMHRWLIEYNQANSHLLMPSTNMRFIICSIEAAKSLPLLSTRYTVNGKDLNRCFGSKNNQGFYQRANLIENAIREVNPEAIVDLHNTSGRGPAFSVCTQSSDDNVSLTSLFCSTMILSHLSLGALMEQKFNCPTITLECGGSQDNEAHELAYEGINRYCSSELIHDCHHNNPVEIIHTPLRLQLKSGVDLTYADKNTSADGVILKFDLEKFNYGIAQRGQSFGWINGCGLEHLELVDADKEDVITDYFTVLNNELICATNIRVFMATPNKNIAINDCIFYVIKQRDIKNTKIPDIDYFVGT